MGYYTFFQLKMQDNNGKPLCMEKIDEINRAFLGIEYFGAGCRIEDYENYEERGRKSSTIEDYINDFINDYIFGEDMKWYDWLEDMTNLSKKFPDIRFILKGEGEDRSYDTWVCYFLNGKYQQEFAEQKFKKSKLW